MQVLGSSSPAWHIFFIIFIFSFPVAETTPPQDPTDIPLENFHHRHEADDNNRQEDNSTIASAHVTPVIMRGRRLAIVLDMDHTLFQTLSERVDESMIKRLPPPVTSIEELTLLCI